MYDLPENKVSSSCRMDFKKLKIYYRFHYYDNRNTEYQTRILPAYFLHNLNVSWQVSRILDLYFKIQNLTDVFYEEEVGYPASGRLITGGFSLSL